MAESLESDVFMQTHIMVDCRRMAARITTDACVKYQKNNDALACVGCSRCNPGELGRAAEWLPYIQSRIGFPKDL
ncbi:hypothetical protein F6V30_09165 [Oryzomonas sagensis]|uniref:Uncharacterized protein n=1 Tax=Oryzomonas sagensis TaxID=2603857 RepID=A0ABQ6TNV4_9BACT|nr:hypothetical protein [Oryzomonas sagensis]KAB0670313.1 hypothetical protein F6V30_09165 [Oryzomonas sagensis]